MTAEPASWPQLLGRLLGGQSLAPVETCWAMGQILAGEASAAQVAGFLVALRAKGETAGEVAGLATAMLDAALPWPGSGSGSGELDRAGGHERPLVDTCGTGGDRAHTVNISTMAALVVAGCGLAVAKHGNRAASSACGSADLLEELGVAIDLPPAGVAACLAAAGCAFCFAPVFHAATRHAAAARRELGVPTVFNILGPLTNPAHPTAQVVGVADVRLAPVMADVLAARGVSALVVHGADGLDEFTTRAVNQVWVVEPGAAVREELVDPSPLGLTGGDLRGGDARENAGVCRRFLAGERGPVRDAVLLNAAAALVAAGASGTAAGSGTAGASGTTAGSGTAGASGTAAGSGTAGASRTTGCLADRLAAALPRATAAVDSGAAAEALDRWVRESQGARGVG